MQILKSYYKKKERCYLYIREVRRKTDRFAVSCYIPGYVKRGKDDDRLRGSSCEYFHSFHHTVKAAEAVMEELKTKKLVNFR